MLSSEVSVAALSAAVEVLADFAISVFGPEAEYLVSNEELTFPQPLPLSISVELWPPALPQLFLPFS
jgi:hypothetical protein